MTRALRSLAHVALAFSLVACEGYGDIAARKEALDGATDSTVDAADGSASVPIGVGTTIEASRDTYADEASPDSNFEGQGSLQISTGSERVALVSFEAGELSEAKTLHPAGPFFLTFDIVGTPEDWGLLGGKIGAYRLHASWLSSQATWNCPLDTEPSAPGITCPGAGWQLDDLSASQTAFEPTPSDTTRIVNGQTTVVRLDVTDDVLNLLENQTGQSHGSWLIRTTALTSSGAIEFASLESAGSSQSGPRIEVQSEAGFLCIDSDQSCDNQDDDCDGNTDEGFL